MVTHIVFWKIKDQHDGMDKAVLCQKIKTDLESLRGVIGHIVSLTVGIDFNRSDMAADCALYSTFRSREDLDAYQKHEAHQKVAAFVRSVALERRVVDYEE